MRRFVISLLLLYSQDIAKAQLSNDSIYVPPGSIRVFDSTRQAWYVIRIFNAGGVCMIDEYDSSSFKLFKTRTAFNLDGSCALKLQSVRELWEGIYAEYFSDGRPKQTGHFYNGFKTGKWLEYYPNGKVSAEYLFRLSHEDSTFIPEKHISSTKNNFKSSVMKVEWGHDNLPPDSYLKYKDINRYEFSYFSPTIPPSWKKYNSSGKIIETSDKKFNQ